MDITENIFIVLVDFIILHCSYLVKYTQDLFREITNMCASDRVFSFNMAIFILVTPKLKCEVLGNLTKEQLPKMIINVHIVICVAH